MRQAVQESLSAAPCFSLFSSDTHSFLLISSALMCIGHGSQSLRGRTCSNVGYPRAPVPLRVLLALECSPSALSFSQCSLPFLKYIFTEALQILLMGSVVSCGRSVVEPPVINCDQHGAAPDLPSQRLHMQPLCPPTTKILPFVPIAIWKKPVSCFIKTKENKQSSWPIFIQDVK